MPLFQKTLTHPFTIFINQNISIKEQNQTLHEGTVKGLSYHPDEINWGLAIFKLRDDNASSERFDLLIKRLLNSHITFQDHGWAGTVEKIEEIMDKDRPSAPPKAVNLRIFWSYEEDPNRPESVLTLPVREIQWLIDHYKNQDLNTW